MVFNANTLELYHDLTPEGARQWQRYLELAAIDAQRWKRRGPSQSPIREIIVPRRAPRKIRKR